MKLLELLPYGNTVESYRAAIGTFLFCNSKISWLRYFKMQSNYKVATAPHVMRARENKTVCMSGTYIALILI